MLNKYNRTYAHNSFVMKQFPEILMKTLLLKGFVKVLY